MSIAEAINHQLHAHSNVVRAHDHIHRDRNECGGVGGCVLMRTEHDVEEELVEALAHAARSGLAVTATITDLETTA